LKQFLEKKMAKKGTVPYRGETAGAGDGYQPLQTERGKTNGEKKNAQKGKEGVKES